MKPAVLITRFKLHHLAGWLVLFFGWHFFRYQNYPPDVGWWITFIKVADLALMVYITNYLLIPRLLYRRQYAVFGLVYVLMIFVCSLSKLYLEIDLLGMSTTNITHRLKDRIYDNVIPHFLLVSTGAAFKLLADHARAQRRLGELAKEKAEAELNFLKSQINPHFLFNSLNSIYFLIDKQNADARQTLLRFSDLLRYQLYDCNAEAIAIEQEVRYLEDYIRLQQLRKDKQYEVKVTVGSNIRGFQITPLLLIPFVENAFKHISHHAEARNFIGVSLTRTNGTFMFTVENSKDDHQRVTEPAGGIGLRNVMRRLELLYPGKHELQIHQSETRFKINLQIHLS